ncbi:hypothetical protein HYALB_00009445 [Hymenoscyphus albidus]|uniref:Uncharacterized protein n=1 Tax=Hymenoscyphus albidus TaxID=595503 RepID=A0A9N9Q840_9HELO|nr:hypothetical protein HYALB_00009445 [Hymenoscyphus albidus]
MAHALPECEAFRLPSPSYELQRSQPMRKKDTPRDDEPVGLVSEDCFEDQYVAEKSKEKIDADSQEAEQID